MHDRVREHAARTGVAVDDVARGGDLLVGEHVRRGGTRCRGEQRDPAVSDAPNTSAAHAAPSITRGSISPGQRSGSAIRRKPPSAAAPAPTQRVGSTRCVCTSITGAVAVGTRASAASSSSSAARVRRRSRRRARRRSPASVAAVPRRSVAYAGSVVPARRAAWPMTSPTRARPGRALPGHRGRTRHSTSAGATAVREARASTVRGRAESAPGRRQTSPPGSAGTPEFAAAGTSLFPRARSLALPSAHVVRWIGGAMRVESSVTSLSWIPSEAVTGVNKGVFDSGFAHYDDPPPDVIEDLEAPTRLGRFPVRDPAHRMGGGRERPHRRRRILRWWGDGLDDGQPDRQGRDLRGGRRCRNCGTNRW